VKAHRHWIAIFTAAAVVVAAVLVASNRGSTGASAPQVRPPAVHPTAFGWARPTGVPASWATLPLPNSPARLPIPSGWHPAESDRGTRTAELKGASGQIDGYLNATPQQGQETLANWAKFRIDHNGEEGDRNVRLIAAASGLRFRKATGSCVLDSYVTSSAHRYREIACILAGRSATTVIVAAAPPRRWAAEAPALERAITSFTT
jgi:hypothetical protein